jgi:hypothetical protein
MLPAVTNSDGVEESAPLQFLTPNPYRERLCERYRSSVRRPSRSPL